MSAEATLCQELSKKHRKKRHGLSRTPEYRAWQTMRLRCIEPKHAAYPSYGGRGITVCDSWVDDPAAFLADMGPKPSEAHELDRRDNDKGYTPENCRWVLRSVNDRNRRSNRWLEAFGERRTLIEWSELKGISSDAINKRLEAGWSLEQALTTGVRPKRKNGERSEHLARKRAAREQSRKLPPGVIRRGRRFLARIRDGGKDRRLGAFATPDEAHEAYLAAKQIGNAVPGRTAKALIRALVEP